MSDNDTKALKAITPVEVVQRSNPLIKLLVANMSEKWHKRWPHIDQPWPKEGTLNPDVIQTVRVLVSAHKAEQKKGRKGERRRDKRQIELEVLQLFENEGQKLVQTRKDEKNRNLEDIEKSTKLTQKLMAEINVPFSHVDAVKKPPPYEKDLKLEKVYPQLPVVNQDGSYHIKDDDDRIIEVGQAETIIKLTPSSKSKKKTSGLRFTGERRYRELEEEDGEDGSDFEGIVGGYDPQIRRMLKRAEKKGARFKKDEDLGDDSSEESEYGDSSEELEGRGSSFSRRFLPTTSSTRIREDRQRTLKEIEKSMEECLSYLDNATTSASQTALGSQLKELRAQKRELQKEESQRSAMALRLRKRKTPEKMCPVIIRGQNIEYKPWQNTDLSDILEKLPTLQDGAHPWISKLEEIMVGTQPAIGDVKRLLASLLGIPAMEELLQKAGLHRYVGTAVNDPELFAAIRGRMWRALRDAFPTNVHPDNILIESLGEEENPRAYVSRALQTWRNITGNDPDLNQMEQSILRAKIQKGLPLPVRSRLAEVVGLGSMKKSVYTDHIAHHVELHRKKERDQKKQDQETLRKLNQMHLGGVS